MCLDEEWIRAKRGVTRLVWKRFGGKIRSEQEGQVCICPICGKYQFNGPDCEYDINTCQQCHTHLLLE